MGIWQKILNFIDSDLYMYICLGSLLIAILLWVVIKVLEYIKCRIDSRELTRLLHKYGLPEVIKAPDYVIVHILCLISIAEKYNLNSLYEAQDKFEELYCCYFKSRNVSEKENYIIQCSGYNFENDNQNHDSSLMELHKTYREHNLGALEYNGKIYDTNFIDGPHLITREVIASLRDEYDSNGKMSDKEIADSYVRHMRRKYGVTDAAGNWLGLLGEEEID